jgi:transketolase
MRTPPTAPRRRPAPDLKDDPVGWLDANPELSNRQVARAALARFADEDPAVVLLEGDLGGGSDPFRERHPARYLNLGICEPTLIDVACGMSRIGWKVFAHTFASFGALRAAEQVRLGMAYHGCPVCLICDYGGLSGAFFGPSHHAIEDLALMRALPGLTIISPADGLETIEALRALIAHERPAYVRLGRNRVSRLPRPGREFVIGKGLWLRNGSDTLLIAHGEVPVAYAMETAELLEAAGVSAGVVNLHTLKPLDERLLEEEAARPVRLLATVEEHSIVGGVGAAICEVISRLRTPARVLRFGVQDRYDSCAGTQESLLAEHGLTPARMASRIVAALVE